MFLGTPGPDILQPGSGRLLTAKARVRFQEILCGRFCHRLELGQFFFSTECFCHFHRPAALILMFHSSIIDAVRSINGTYAFFAWFHASVAMLMRSALFWGITKRRVVNFYRRFGTTCRSHLQESRSPRSFLDFLNLKDGINRLTRNVGKGLPSPRSFLDFLTLKDGTDRLSRNVGKGLPSPRSFLDFLTLKDGIDRLSRNVGKGLPSPRSFLDLLTLEDGTDRLARNVGKRLPLDAA
jgi:hypothetical protein